MLKKIFTYGVGSVFCRIISYILLPLYTNHIAVADFGEASLSLTTATMLLSFVFMELWSAFLRFGYDNNQIDFNKLYTNILVMIVLISPIFAIVTFGVGQWQNLSYLSLMILFGITQVIFYVEQFICRIKKMAVAFVISGVLSSVSQLTLAFILVEVGKLTPQSMLYIPIISSIVSMVYIFIVTYQYQKISFVAIDYNYIKELVFFSFPLSLNSAAYWGMTNIGVYIARARLGMEINAYISVASRFMVIVMYLVGVYNLAWQETAFELCDSPQRGRIYSDEFKKFADAVCCITIGAIIIVDILFPFYIGKSEYHTAQLLLPLYFAGTYINSISAFLGILYSVEKRNNILVYSSIIGCITTTITVYILIGWMGVFSVPAGFFVGVSVNTLFRYLLIANRVKFNVDKCSILKNIGIIAMFVDIVLFGINSWVEILCGGMAIMYFIVKWKQMLCDIMKNCLRIPVIQTFILATRKIVNSIIPKNKKYIYVIPHSNGKIDCYDILNPNSDNALTIISKICNESELLKGVTLFVECYDEERLNVLNSFIKDRQNKGVKIKLIKTELLERISIYTILRKITKRYLMMYRCATWITDTWLFGFNEKNIKQNWIALNYSVPFKKPAYPGKVAVDTLVETSEITAKVHGEGYNLTSERMSILGFPRNDSLLYNDRKEAVLARINSKIDFEYEHIVVYAPTYRDYVGAYSTGCIFGYEYEPDKLEKFLEENKILVVAKMHPLQEVGSSIYTKHVLEYEKSYDFSLYDVLAVSDMLISDYSSVIHDYILTGKKVIHNFFDKDKYDATRGFAFNPIEDVCPGPIATTMDELKELIKKELSNNVVSDKYKNVVKMFHRYPDGNSTERVMNFLVKEIQK